MTPANLREQELMKTLLEPLLEDFQYWFTRARTLLESEAIPFLSEQEQKNLLDRVIEQQKEVTSAQILFQAMGQQVGIEMKALMPWHQLVMECWQVSLRLRASKQQNHPLP
jgi:cytochrome c peroxidase